MLAEEKTANNVDSEVVRDFGNEWAKFNQKDIDDTALLNAFNDYFSLFPFDLINHSSVGFDMGCGSGRWAKVMAQKVGTLHCIDASHVALAEARKNLSQFNNCHFECASVADVSIEDASQDFGYCLGVLHHIPDTQAGLKSCADKLKSGAPFLLYLYYKLENKPWWFQKIWRFSDLFRQFICQLPFGIKHWLCQLIALIVYWPLSRASLLLEKLGFNVDDIPLSAYRNKSLYFLRTDALDRFGTKREARFTKGEIASMMRVAGFKDISFSDKTPYWVAVGIKA